MWRARSRLLAGLVAGLLLAGCGGHVDPAASVSSVVELTREQPLVAIEFEASFVTLHKSSGIDAQLAPMHPQRPGDTDVIVRELSYWDGELWVDGTAPPITVKGLNGFRFRWVIELDESLERATVPIEAELRPSWDDGLGPPPRESEIADASLEIVSIYPVEGY